MIFLDGSLLTPKTQGIENLLQVLTARNGFFDGFFDGFCDRSMDFVTSETMISVPLRYTEEK
jgi:hypothetical protein